MIGGVKGERVGAGVDRRAAGDLRRWVMVGPPLLASVVSSTVLMSIVPAPPMPTMLPFVPSVMPPEVAASPMRLLLAVLIGLSRCRRGSCRCCESCPQ